MWLVLPAVLVTLLPGVQSRCDSAICRTKGCYTLVAEMYRHLNTSVDPCEDMYGFACGKWIRETIPQLQGGMVPQIIYDRRDSIFPGLIKEEIKADDLEAAKKVKTYMKSCTKAVGDDHGLQQAKDLLQDILGGLPMLTPQ